MTTREYAKNLFSQWSDDDFCDQPLFDKLLFQVLNGQRAVNLAGVLPINYTRWATALKDGGRLPTDRDIKAALVRMERRRYVYTDEKTGEVLIRSRVRRDELEKQPNMFISALRLIAVFDSPKFAAVMMAELDRMELPEVRPTAKNADRTRDTLKRSYDAARQRLQVLVNGVEQCPLPFAADFPDGLPEPFPNPSERVSEPFRNPSGTLREGFPRPAEMEPFRKGSGNPSGTPREPSGSGSVSVSTSPTKVVTLGESAEIEQPTGDTEPEQPSNEPPSAATRLNDPEPPARCPRHRGKPEFDGKCPPCGEFRKARDRWEERDRRRQAQAVSDAAHAAAAARTAAIDACQLCDHDGYRGKQVCNHRAEPSTPDVRTRARELVHAALSAKQRTEPSDVQDDETAPADVPGPDDDE